MCKGSNINPTIKDSNKNILVISHTCLSQNDSMGSTLASYLSSFPQNNIYQFYIKKMAPNAFKDAHYYNWTDHEAIKNILNPLSKRFKGTPEVAFSNDAQTAKKEEITNGANWKKRSALLLLRHFAWSISIHLNKQLWSWIKNANPRAIVLMPGDFQFVFKLAHKIANKFKVPIIIMQCESYLLKPYFEKNIAYKIYRKSFKKWYLKTMRNVNASIYLCDELKTDYEKIFPSSKHITIMRPYPAQCTLKYKIKRVPDTFIYAGNLGLATGRQDALNNLCKSLNKSTQIDIYTGTPKEQLGLLENYTNVNICGFIDSNTLAKEYLSHEYVIHVENSSAKHLVDLKYAFSTKICDIMAFGCIGVAIGSSKIAGIKYLKDNNLAIVAETPEQISEKLHSLTIKEKHVILNNCKNVLEKNHSLLKNAELFKSIILNSAEIKS